MKYRPTCRSKHKPKVSQDQQDWLAMELQTMRELNETRIQNSSGIKTTSAGSVGKD